MHDSSSMCSPTTMSGNVTYRPRSATTIEGSEHNPETPRSMTAPKELPNTGTREGGRVFPPRTLIPN